MLLNAAKDVASALGALINATKNASGKPNNDPSTEVLKTTGKVHYNSYKLNSVSVSLETTGKVHYNSYKLNSVSVSLDFGALVFTQLSTPESWLRMEVFVSNTSVCLKAVVAVFY